MNYTGYPRIAAEEVVRLRRRIAEAGVPSKVNDRNLLIATWNIRRFGALFDSFEENDGSPKRNLRGPVHIAEIIQRFDVIAVQEVGRELTGLRRLLDLLGPHWGLVVSDVSGGDAGNSERLAYLYDRRRVEPSGLAGELVLPPMEGGDPARQFARTPFAVSFKSGPAEFILVTLHVLFGDVPADREPELRAIAEWLADWGSDEQRFHADLIALGDFNIDKEGDPRFEAFTSAGLFVPESIRGQRTTIFQTNAKHFDQIAWFRDQIRMQHTGAGGTVDFADAVYRELTNAQKSHRVSDHVPLWVEFTIDEAPPQLGEVLGLTEVELGSPDPFGSIPD